LRHDQGVSKGFSARCQKRRPRSKAVKKVGNSRKRVENRRGQSAWLAPVSANRSQKVRRSKQGKRRGGFKPDAAAGSNKEPGTRPHPPAIIAGLMIAFSSRRSITLNVSDRRQAL